MKFIDATINNLFIPVAIWVFASVMASGLTAGGENCQNDYPIGYVLHIKLFCPIEEVQSDQP